MDPTVKPKVDLADAFLIEAPALADWLIVAPLVIGFVFAAICLMTRKDTGRQPAIALTGLVLILLSVVGLFVHVLANGTVIMAMGRWLPPFGIAFVADTLGATLALVSGIVGLAAGVYALREIDNTEMRYGFYPFLLMMLAGVICAFVTGDIFNLYVWFEVLLLGSFGLLILGSRREQLDGATKYAFLNLVATTLFLIAVAYLYGLFGTLNMADIARKAAVMDDVGPRLTIAALFFFAFAMKAAAFPLSFWLPASYHTPRLSVGAVFAGLLTKVGVYALLRILLTLFPADRDDLAFAIAVVAAASMVLGALGALAQTDMRRLLGYLVISGIGVMLAGLALGSATGLSGAAFYTAHSMVVMTALYLLVGVVGAAAGTFDLHRAGGLYASMPSLAVIALVLALSASGLPPFSGLWPKIFLVKASIDVGAWWLAGAILLSGFVTTIALVRLFAYAFWRPAHADARAPDPATVPVVAVGYPVLAGLCALTAIAGVHPEPFIQVSDRIAFELMNPGGYIEAVYGAPPAVADVPAEGGMQ